MLLFFLFWGSIILVVEWRIFDMLSHLVVGVVVVIG